MKSIEPMEFDRFSQNYQGVLDRAIEFSGDNAEYFTDYKARYVAGLVGQDFSGTILDFGCGVGLLSLLLKKRLPAASVHGYDVSSESIQMIPAELKKQGRFSDKLGDLDQDYKIAVMANVLHHVPKIHRQETLIEIADRLVWGGKLFVFEHNPWNPVTRWVVHKCAFDEDAVLLRPTETRTYLSRARLRLRKNAYIVFFPNLLSVLRRFEPVFSWLPAGAQYVIVGEKCVT